MTSHPDDAQRLDLRDLPRALRRRWRLFAGLLAGTVALVMAVTFVITPVWESESSVRIREAESGGLGGGLLSGIGSALGDIEQSLPSALPIPELSGGDVQTEIGILTSRRIVEEVADSLALHVSLRRPWRAYRTEVLRVLEAGPGDPEGVFTLRLRPDGTYDVSARGLDRDRPPPELPASVAIGTPFSVGTLRLALDPELAGDPPGTVRFEVVHFEEMMRDLRDDLRVYRSDSGSRLVVAEYRHPDPELARAVVNGLLDRYLAYARETNQGEPGREARILERQVADHAARLAELEAELERYQEAELLVAPEEQAVVQVERIAEIRLNYDGMRVEREALAEVLRTVDERAGAGATGAAGGADGAESGSGAGGVAGAGVDPELGTLARSPYRQLATFPRFIENEGIQTLLESLTELENERSGLLVLRTPANRDARMLEVRIREIEDQLHGIAADFLNSLDSQIASAREALDRFEAELSAMPRVVQEYVRLERERQILSRVYSALQLQLADARVQEAVTDERARVVDRGVIEDRPAFPRPEISLALSGALGLMLGLFGVVMAETTSTRIRTGPAAEEAAGAPLLGAVPGLEGEDRGRGAGVLMVRDPWHPASEAVRSVALALGAGATGGAEDSAAGPGLLLLTGPGDADAGSGAGTAPKDDPAGAGVGLLSANLAAAFARQGISACLVDADLRRGRLHALFGVEIAPGWPRAVVDGSPLEEAAREVAVEGAAEPLRLLTRGESSVHPMDFLTSRRARSFLAGLAERYDAVVVSAPSLAAGADAVALAGGADGVVLVARSGKTEAEALGGAADELARAGGRIRGVVLTGYV